MLLKSLTISLICLFTATTAFAHGTDSAIELADSWGANEFEFSTVVECIDAAQTKAELESCRKLSDSLNK